MKKNTSIRILLFRSISVLVINILKEYVNDIKYVFTKANIKSAVTLEPSVAFSSRFKIGIVPGRWHITCLSYWNS